ncbi:thioredoxin family protein [Aquimarina longa]|uniref:thioredoxin family protein n=1 Tax=Aquimarina longa TaxID=1080221 RepID=UPI000782F56F|nr:thioredoxin family protein [Aquimarina longa]
MKIVSIIVFFFLFITYQNTIAQIKLHSFESLEYKMEIAPKPIVVFIHTDWCIYCKNMENTTLKNSHIIQKLNTNFYFISLNAESRESIIFLNNTFNFQPNGHRTGVHELAKELATVNNKIGYPTLTILNNKYEIIFQKQSFLSANQLLEILKKIS